MVRFSANGLLLGLLLSSAAQAQPEPGNGLRADYYAGMNFERLLHSRHDATIDFDWKYRPPAPRVPSEYFSVRWTGWLQVPVSGRYQFRVVVDDGMRIWLNDKLVLDEWRDQPVSQFTFAIDMKADKPYKLRVDYYQNILDTRASITWVMPPEALPPPESWGILRAIAPRPGEPMRISTAYLYTENPTPPPPVAAQPAPEPVRQPAAAPPPPARETPAPRPPAPAPAPRPVPATPPPAITAAADSGAARLDRLAEGEAVTLPELYFDQGQAMLLPPARAALDGLAPALRARPGLRLEVQGHTDNQGNAELNRQLSQRRAEAVCLYLIAHGVPAGQLRAKGYGSARPVANNNDPAQRPRNRRVMLQRL